MERGVTVLEIVDLAIGADGGVQATTTGRVNAELGRRSRERSLAELEKRGELSLGGRRDFAQKLRVGDLGHGDGALAARGDTTARHEGVLALLQNAASGILGRSLKVEVVLGATIFAVDANVDGARVADGERVLGQPALDEVGLNVPRDIVDAHDDSLVTVLKRPVHRLKLLLNLGRTSDAAQRDVILGVVRVERAHLSQTARALGSRLRDRHRSETGREARGTGEVATGLEQHHASVLTAASVAVERGRRSCRRLKGDLDHLLALGRERDRKRDQGGSRRSGRRELRGLDRALNEQTLRLYKLGGLMSVAAD